MEGKIKTGFSVILARQGDRAILTYPGSIPALKMSDVDFSLISKCRHLHLSGYFLLDQLRPDIKVLFNKAKELGLSLSLDTNYDPTGNWDHGLSETLPFVDVFLPNKTEAQAISGEKSVENALQKLAEIMPIVAIKLGDAGALTKWKGHPRLKQEVVAVKVVDTVGAGDSFDAGFIYGYLNGWSPERTLRLAVTCGSLSTLKPGGTAGQVRLEEALEYVEREV